MPSRSSYLAAALLLAGTSLSVAPARAAEAQDILVTTPLKVEKFIPLAEINQHPEIRVVMPEARVGHLGMARDELAALGYVTGQMSVDVFEAPIVAQSWFVLNRIREMAQECGGDMKDVVKLVQYFRDLRHYPAYNRVRGLFFPQPVVSTVVEVSRMLPSDAVLVEVEATAWLPTSNL